MDQEALTQQEMARRRIQARHRRQIIRKKQQRRRLILLAICASLLIILVAACHIFRSAPEEKPQPETKPEALFTAPIGPEYEPVEEQYAHVDITPLESDLPLIQELKKMAVHHPKIKKILANIELYPEDLLQALLKNDQILDFAVDYPEKKDRQYQIDLSEEASIDEVPLLLQWDERWGYQKYGSGLIGWTACGPTCVSMVSLYLTGNEAYSPDVVARWAENSGYYSIGSGTAWLFMSEGTRHFGIVPKELALVHKHMVDELNAGHPIICSMKPGDFTSGGHYIVLTGYDEEKGFSVNDPNSPANSAEYWSYKTLEPQISNLWAFSKA